MKTNVIAQRLNTTLRKNWRVLHPDEESDSDFSDYSTSDDCSDCPSDFNEWVKWNEKRWKYKRKVKSCFD